MIISKKKLLRYLEDLKKRNQKEKLYAKYPPDSEKQEILNAYSTGYEHGVSNAVNAIKAHIRFGRWR